MKILLAKHAGFCPGVRRATEAVEAALCECPAPKRILTLGELIHNAVYLEELAARGIAATDEDGAAKAAAESDIIGRTLLFFRTHGVSRATEDRMRALCEQHPNFEVRDLTCPFVKRVHTIAEEAEGLFCLFGKDSHPEVMGTVDRSKNPPILFEHADELEKRILDIQNVGLGITMAAQTTMGEEEWKKSKKFLKKLYTNPKIFDTICSVTKNRQEEAAKLAAMADVTIVIGGRTSSNTKELYNIAAAHCPDTRLIERIEELAPPPAQNITVAITAGASTPDGLIMEVYKKWTKPEASPKCWKKHSKL